MESCCDSRPVIAITMGDPAGVGPEVIVKALGKCPELYKLCSPLVVGSPEVIRWNVDRYLPPPQRPQVTEVTQDDVSARCVKCHFGVIPVLCVAPRLSPADFVLGKPQKVCGTIAMRSVDIAARLALAGHVDGVCNAPINKEAAVLAGFEGLGHLEYYGKLTKSKEYATMLATGNLRVVHLTTHYSLRKACDLVQKDRILKKIVLTYRSLVSWGLCSPRIAIAALNPHGSEGGMFGSEEADEIEPAVQAAKALGINAIGPIPADSVFTRAIHGEFDCVLAMYHDQGHIPIKVHGFEKSVSVALGLPFVRTSVDHGTAFSKIIYIITFPFFLHCYCFCCFLGIILGSILLNYIQFLHHLFCLNKGEELY